MNIDDSHELCSQDLTVFRHFIYCFSITFYCQIRSRGQKIYTVLTFVTHFCCVFKSFLMKFVVIVWNYTIIFWTCSNRKCTVLLAMLLLEFACYAKEFISYLLGSWNISNYYHLLLFENFNNLRCFWRIHELLMAHLYQLSGSFFLLLMIIFSNSFGKHLFNILELNNINA